MQEQLSQYNNRLRTWWPRFPVRFPAETRGSPPQRPDYLGAPSNIWPWEPFRREWRGRDVKLVIQLHTLPKLRMCGANLSWRDADSIEHRSSYNYPFLVFWRWFLLFFPLPDILCRKLQNRFNSVVICQVSNPKWSYFLCLFSHIHYHSYKSLLISTLNGAITSIYWIKNYLSFQRHNAIFSLKVEWLARS